MLTLQQTQGIPDNSDQDAELEALGTRLSNAKLRYENLGMMNSVGLSTVDYMKARIQYEKSRVEYQLAESALHAFFQKQLSDIKGSV